VHHCTTSSSYVFATKALTIGKKLLNNNISPTSPHNMVNFGPLTAEICWRVCSSPAAFNGIRVLVLLLQQHRSTEANQTLYDVWPSPGLRAGTVYIHFRGLLPHNGILPGAKFNLHPRLALSYIVSVTARHSSNGRQPNFADLSRGRHLYSAGLPSRWALAHILVVYDIPGVTTKKHTHVG